MTLFNRTFAAYIPWPMSTIEAIPFEPSEPESDDIPPADPAAVERARIQEQLAQLARRQAELHRALAIADHPALGDAIREVEGRAYGVTRVETQLAQPLSKDEARQCARVEKKLAALREKRAALDVQIESLEAELTVLSDDKVRALTEQRSAALHQLFVVLARHADAFDAAGLKIAELVPDLVPWLPELRALAETGRGAAPTVVSS